MSAKKVIKKSPKTTAKQKRKFKYIKGKELVTDPFNLN